MTANDLHAIGQYLFGGGWQTALANALNINTRTVQRWAAGDIVPPAGAWQDIIELAAEKQVIDAWPVIEGIFKQHGPAARIDLHISGIDDKVASIHKRSWTRAVDKQIKQSMTVLLAAHSIKAVVLDE